VLPANTTRPGSWWPGPVVRGDGRAHELLVIPEKQSRLTITAFPTEVGGIVATPVAPERTVALARACGRAVDWYQPRS
jgi:hypothetical protein